MRVGAHDFDNSSVASTLMVICVCSSGGVLHKYADSRKSTPLMTVQLK